MSRTILITGANRGIGLEMTRQAAARGDHVIALCRDATKMPKVAGNVTALSANVTDEASLAKAATQINGPVDVLVCNAGMLVGRGGLDDAAYTAQSWQDTLMTNVTGPFFTVRAFRAALGRAKGAKVAIISSVMASSTRASGSSYSYRASKAAAANLACNLAIELKGAGIAVGAYHPGWVRTDMGGSSADIAAEDSAAGLLSRFDTLSLATTGVFEDYKGVAIAF